MQYYVGIPKYRLTSTEVKKMKLPQILKIKTTSIESVEEAQRIFENIIYKEELASMYYIDNSIDIYIE